MKLQKILSSSLTIAPGILYEKNPIADNIMQNFFYELSSSSKGEIL